MKILILTDYLHHKNQIGLKNVLEHLKIAYEFTTDKNKIKDYDVIYSPANPIDTSKFPNKRFLFGPHFSVFPDDKLKSIKNVNRNALYIQPSKWCVDKWKNMGVENYLPITSFPFPVEVDKFRPCVETSKKDKVFVYFKRRKQEELKFVTRFLTSRNIEYKIFDYVARYNEGEYIEYLQHAKYGIILGTHESQGFAYEEALSCDVPLLVWNVRYLNQEVGCNYPALPATSIEYWDERCGEYFFDATEFSRTFETFISKLGTYRPRDYIMENLSVEPCAKRFQTLVSF